MLKTIFAAITFVLLSFSTYAEDKAIIVFDASGSMWAQVDGKTKIEIAKKTLGNLVNNWDESKQLGLLAYGHRKKGDCKDIQTLVPVGKINKAKMISKVNKINPKGKTPISASIRMAADELKFTEDNATVILISDGKETCNADPCATAAELEKLGVNFTAHVIGFAVDKETSKQLKCIADNTGGKYFSADNAEELNDALIKVVEQPKVLTIKAIDEKMGGTLDKRIAWKLINQDTEEVFSIIGNGNGKDITIAGKEPAENTLATGKWLVSGTSGIYTGEATIEVTGDENQIIKVNMNKQLPKVTITAADEATIGTILTVTWDAPKDSEALINLQSAEDRKPSYNSRPYFYTKGKAEVAMRLPGVAGDYVLRYYNIKDRKTVLAERPITLKQADITITAPDETGTGTEIDISWTAPKTSEALINLQLADEKPNYNSRPYVYTKKKKEGSMRMPATEGDYVLRWYNQSDRKVITERPIKLIKEVITVNAPDEVGTGAEIDLSWIAPKSSEALINLQLADEKPNYNSRPYLYTKGKKEASMRMPSTAGDYVLRYFNQSDRKVITERPIKLIEKTITINVPDEATAGIEIELSWDAPKGLDAFINMQLSDEKPSYNAKHYKSTTKKQSTYMRMPSITGDYILRWYNRGDKKVVAERPITLTAAEINIIAPEEGTAGTELEVSWSASKGLDSFINIQLADEKPSYNARNYISTTKRASAYLRLPSKTGDYMLRWYNRGQRKSIAERAVKLVAPEINIIAPDEAVAGSEMELNWQAPKNMDSFINLQKEGEKPNYHAKTYVTTNKRISSYMKIPEETGDYVLRWFNRRDKGMIAEQKIKIISKE